MDKPKGDWRREAQHLLLARDWSMRRIARAVGVHHSTISRWLRRRHVEALCEHAVREALGV